MLLCVSDKRNNRRCRTIYSLRCSIEAKLYNQQSVSTYSIVSHTPPLGMESVEGAPVVYCMHDSYGRNLLIFLSSFISVFFFLFPLLVCASRRRMVSMKNAGKWQEEILVEIVYTITRSMYGELLSPDCLSVRR